MSKTTGVRDYKKTVDGNTITVVIGGTMLRRTGRHGVVQAFVDKKAVEIKDLPNPRVIEQILKDEFTTSASAMRQGTFVTVSLAAQ